MNWLILVGAMIAAVVLTWTADRLGFVDLSNKATKSGGSGGVLAMMDVFAPTKQETQAEFERQTRLPVEAPSPARDEHDLLSGQVLIKLPSVPAAGQSTKRLGMHDRSW